ncbi:hypothetical protein Ccrd_023226 [Cynara cardunculus var. scolymus]|uniref:Uncharacterized protein n=1 Tax=Cynara cardunculus var. scolymus TaxID=59895 RepID=A0A103XX66_CYNCS|nr:hypothetical protein Ccrd_023226 [Cynara cardunculus var. scolymus]
MAGGTTKKELVVAKASNVYPKDAEAPPCRVDDMTKLAYLHEPGVLSNLRSRYDINEILRSRYDINEIYLSYLVPYLLHYTRMSLYFSF